jgi:hypothetical protein
MVTWLNNTIGQITHTFHKFAKVWRMKKEQWQLIITASVTIPNVKDFVQMAVCTRSHQKVSRTLCTRSHQKVSREQSNFRINHSELRWYGNEHFLTRYSMSRFDYSLLHYFNHLSSTIQKLLSHFYLTISKGKKQWDTTTKETYYLIKRIWEWK